MQYNALGRSSLKVSEIGFGCMSLPVARETETIDLIHEAMDNGINYFDTADLYDKGVNEITVGKALQGKRGKVVLATKVGNEWRSDGSGWDWNPRKDYILKSVEGSLRRLQTDHIDLYQLHGGTIDDPIDETIDAFEMLKRQGKIREYGISSIRPNVISEYVRRSSIVSVMMQYSLADRRPEEDMLELLHKHQISVLARGALAQGMLVNKPSKDYLGYSKEEIEKIQKAVHQLAGNRNPVSTAIQYVLHHPAVAAAVIGIRTSVQLHEVIDIGSPLSQNDYLQLQLCMKPNVYEQHRLDY